MKLNIYLVGFMGTGKSTVGKELARLLGRKFIDTDEVLEKKFNMNISDIFEKYGAEFFQEQEYKLAKELSQTSNKVISTGGNTLLNSEIKYIFSNTGVIICLFTQEKKLTKRLTKTSRRPELKDVEDLEEKVRDLLAKKKDIYNKVSIQLDTTFLSPKESALKILDLFKTRQKILDKLKDQYIILR